MLKTNNERLQEIAEAMQDLNERLVYVGGAIAGLYANDPFASEPRTTTDVDCVVDSTSYGEHAAFEEMLRAKHFQNDQTPNAPLCRWLYNGEIVDVMSMDENTLSFGNPWYRPGFYKRELYTLPSGKAIYRLTATYFIATKIAALLSRGGNDWRGAKDLEDIVYVLNYCTDFIDRFKTEDTEVQSYVSWQLAAMLRRPNFAEEIECAISSDDIDRTDMVLETIKSIADYQSTLLRIQYVSDLHLEFPQNRAWLEEHPLEVTGDILLIAGDTAYLDTPKSGQDIFSRYSFWDWAAEHYRQVIVCFGNHDFYGYYDLATIPNGYCKEIRPNIHAYYNAVVHLDDVDIIVSTLWSYIEPCYAYITERGVSDFYRIRYEGHRLNSYNFNQEHEKCLRFIKQAVAESKATTKIVLTHHVPTQRCTAEEFRGSEINGAFTVELGDYIADSGIDYWIYGHSHRNIDAQIGKTKITSNQLGYVSYGEHLANGFDPKKNVVV